MEGVLDLLIVLLSLYLIFMETVFVRQFFSFRRLYLELLEMIDDLKEIEKLGN